MKMKKLLVVLLIAPLMAGCGDKKKEKDPLVIPTVDVDNIQVSLPELPTYNQGTMRSDDNYDYIDIYEVSDFHGAIDYEPDHSSGTYLGLPKLATYLNNKRALNAGGTIVVSSGDMFQGTADSNLTRGYLVNYAMKYMGFDSMAIGNHEFDWTVDWLKKNAELKYNTVTTPFLGANIIDKNTQQIPDFLKKSTIIERGDYKVGVIGTIGADLKGSILSTLVANYDFKEETEIVKAEAAALRASGCDFVIWTAHQGVDKLTLIDGVDAIFGGHAHENKVGVGPICATANYGQGVAHIELKIDKTSKVAVPTAEVDEFTTGYGATIEENSGIKQIIAQYTPEIDKIKNIELGTLDKDLSKDNEELGNIAVQTMFDKAKAFVGSSSLGIDANHILGAYHNLSGGIRADVKAGTVTYGGIYKPFPFDNELVLLKVKGKRFVNIIDSMPSNLACCSTIHTIDEIQVSEYYYLALTDFIALSPNFFAKTGLFDDITENDLVHTNITIRDSVAEFIYNLDEIKAEDFSSRNKAYSGIKAL